MGCYSVDKNINAFTIVELMVAIMISVILLGWIFYFMSETILGISRSSAQSNFLKDFYGFTTILDTWDLEVLHDYTLESFDVWLLRSLDNTSGVLIGVVDNDTLQLSKTGSTNTYHNSVLWYRSLSNSEIINIAADPDIIYSYDFFPDKLFSRFNLQNFQLINYNSWAIVEMELFISPSYNQIYYGQDWLSLPRDEIFKYSLVF